MMDSPVAIGVDLSLTRTGVALVGSGNPGAECFSFGRKGKNDEPLLLRNERIDDTVRFIQGIVADGTEWPKIAVVEYPSTAAAGGHSLDRDALWWLTLKMLWAEGIPVVSPVTQKLKIYATGKGTGVDKAAVMLAMLRRHPDAPFQNDDEADALGLAYMGARLIGEPLDGKLAKDYVRALDGMKAEFEGVTAHGVAWP